MKELIVLGLLERSNKALISGWGSCVVWVLESVLHLMGIRVIEIFC